MPIDFSKEEALYLYGRLRKKVAELEEIKATPGNPIAKESMDQEILFFSTMTEKIKAAHPSFEFLDRLL